MRGWLVAGILGTATVAHAGKVRVTELVLDVEPTNAKGKPWDRSADSVAEPDLVVKLRANGHKLTSCDAGDDTVHGSCQLDETFELTRETRIELEVFDDDGGLISPGDKIGTGVIAHLELDEPARVAFDVNGQVRSASLTIAPVPGWFAQHRPGLLAFGFGIAGALGVVGVFRKRLLAPDPPPPPMPRCAHCSAELRKRDRRCFNCGAPR